LANAIAARIADLACGLFFQQVEPTISDALETMSIAFALLSSAKDSKPICSSLVMTLGPTPFTVKRALRSSGKNGIGFPLSLARLLLALGNVDAG
jgi:hypothetical protein